LKTYVERFLQDDPPGFRLDLKVVQIVARVRGGQRVNDRAVVVGVLVGGRHSQNVCADAGVLFHVLHVFLNIEQTVCRTIRPSFSELCTRDDRSGARIG